MDFTIDGSFNVTNFVIASTGSDINGDTDPFFPPSDETVSPDLTMDFTCNGNGNKTNGIANCQNCHISS